jgi:hypothetical protein
MMDMEFEKLKPLMPHVALNTTAAQEHVADIEQKIRVIKERARGTFTTLPYKKLPMKKSSIGGKQYLDYL